MDGEDLSKYDSSDDVIRRRQVDDDDMEALEQLEWELASHTGRVTGMANLATLNALASFYIYSIVFLLLALFSSS